jgi:TrpR-related protein YerC/YecD
MDSELWNRDAGTLLRVLLRLRTSREARRFLRDLMTEDEIRMIVDRWRVARMLHAGCSYREIGMRTGLSSRTIARISRWLREGEGGYRAALAEMDRPRRGRRVDVAPARR